MFYYVIVSNDDMIIPEHKRQVCNSLFCDCEIVKRNCLVKISLVIYGLRKPTEAHRGTRKPSVVMDEHRRRLAFSYQTVSRD